MKYILIFDLSILNIFQVLKINGFVNYIVSKYGNVFQYKVNILRIYLFEDKLKWIIEIVYAWIFWNINSLWNL